jgi:hypothetical protein
MRAVSMPGCDDNTKEQHSQLKMASSESWSCFCAAGPSGSGKYCSVRSTLVCEPGDTHAGVAQLAQGSQPLTPLC